MNKVEVLGLNTKAWLWKEKLINWNVSKWTRQKYLPPAYPKIFLYTDYIHNFQKRIRLGYSSRVQCFLHMCKALG